MPSVRVLVVDDHEPFRRAAAAIIGATDGFTVVGEVGDGEAALAAAERLRPDLVLMDVNLPGMDGLEATRGVRRLDPSPVVVLLSTYELSDLGDEALRCGSSGYIPKSELDPDRLRLVWASV